MYLLYDDSTKSAGIIDNCSCREFNQNNSGNILLVFNIY